MNTFIDINTRRDEVSSFLQRVIWYPNFKRVYDDMVHFLTFSGFCEEMLIVQGPVGAGKSFLRDLIERDYPTIKTDEKTCHQVLSCRVAPENTMTGILGNFLLEMGDPVPTSCSIVSRRHRLKRQIEQQGTKMILLDEAQSMLPRNGGDDKSGVFKILRELTDDLRIPIVLLGKEYTYDVVKHDDALRSRVRSVFELEHFSCKEPEAALDFADYITALLKYFPRKTHGWDFVQYFDDDSMGLASNINNLIRLVLATGGSQRSLRYLFKSLIENTVPDTCVSMKHCADYYYAANNLEKPLSFNPFSEKMEKVIKEAEKRGLYDRDNF